MKLQFQNRVALYNTIAASIIIALVYAIIFIVVYSTDFNHLDQDIRLEKDRVTNMLEYRGDSIITYALSVWERKENEILEANPVFVQITDNSGQIIFRSANLLHKYYLFKNNAQDEIFSNKIINKGHFRQGQFPLRNVLGRKIGSANIGISGEESYMVIHNLLLILIFSYPILIICLYFFLLFSVSKAIAPVRHLIKIASGINDTNIGTRMPLPEKEDEIYQLASTINDLLDRIEKSMNNQKQFTADASHEMRTPLSAIRGIMEVSIRKIREPKQYEKKIKEVIIEVDRMHLLMEQLLQLARLNAGVITAKFVPVDLKYLLETLRDKWMERLDEKTISLQLAFPANKEIMSDSFLLEIVIENLVSNAIKYGREGGHICVKWQDAENALTIADDGEGIAAEHIPHLFDRFYRADESRNSKVPGNGLGLAIVKKIANLLNINISVCSKVNEGTTFTLCFSPDQFKPNLSTPEAAFEVSNGNFAQGI